MRTQIFMDISSGLKHSLPESTEDHETPKRKSKAPPQWAHDQQAITEGEKTHTPASLRGSKGEASVSTITH